MRYPAVCPRRRRARITVSVCIRNSSSNLRYGGIQRHKSLGFDDRLRQGFGNGGVGGQQLAHGGAYDPGIDATLAKLFGEGVDSVDACSGVDTIGGVHVGVRHLERAVEKRRLPEHDIVVAGTQAPAHGTHTFEPHAFHGGCTVGEQPHESHLGAFAEHVEGYETATDLHMRHVVGGIVVEAADGVGLASVEICRGIMPQKVGCCVQPEFRFQQAGACWPYAFHIFYVGLCEAEHQLRLWIMACAVRRSAGVVIFRLVSSESTRRMALWPAAIITERSSVKAAWSATARCACRSLASLNT